jgi:hypothetical protein
MQSSIGKGTKASHIYTVETNKKFLAIEKQPEYLPPV